MKGNTHKKKKKNSLFRRAVAWLHLWPSIVSGLVLVFVCLTGTIIVYGDEIMDWSAGDAKYVEVAGPRITANELTENLHRQYPDVSLSEYVFFKNPTRSIRLRVFNPKEKKLALAYMNPYTGEVIKMDYTIHFFFVTAHLHAALLAGTVGGWIVAISTIIFVISCLTGLVLWWPKRWTKHTRKASFTVRWKARFKRLNYDLHNVYGFYSLIVCRILGITGLLIYFPSMSNIVIKASGGALTHLEEQLPRQDTTRKSLDMVAFAYKVLENNPEKKMVNIWNYERSQLGAYIFTSGKVGLKSVENAAITVYNRYTGEEIPLTARDLQHEKTENIIWQLHMGQWWGQFGKLSTFLAGIVSTTLPITGFLIWWGRRKKKKRKAALGKLP